MPYKLCPKCGGVSYSASSQGKWICPHCGADLTDIEAKMNKDDLQKK